MSQLWCAICSRWAKHSTDGHDVFDVLAGEMSADEAAEVRGPCGGRCPGDCGWCPNDPDDPCRTPAPTDPAQPEQEGTQR